MPQPFAALSGHNYGAAFMNDADEGQNASGSWQPDPTGRYKLRWRSEAGGWTDHVYSEDGKMGSDPYDAPTEQPPPTGQAPPKEPPSAPQSELPETSDTGPRTMVCERCGHTDFVAKRDRVLWHVCFWLLLWYVLPFLRKRPYCARCGMRGEWLTDEKKPKPPIYRRWWAFVLYGFVILVVIANLVDDDEEEESAVSAPSTAQASSEIETALAQAPTTAAPTTAAPTTRATTATTAATTTIVRTTTTSPQTWTADDCANYSSALEFLTNEVAGLFAQLALEATFADVTGMQETYTTLEWAMDGLPEATYTMIEICRAHVPQSAIDLVELALEEATSDWRELRRTCRSELADFGFEC